MLLDARHLADSYQCSCYMQMTWLCEAMRVYPSLKRTRRAGRLWKFYTKPNAASFLSLIYVTLSSRVPLLSIQSFAVRLFGTDRRNAAEELANKTKRIEGFGDNGQVLHNNLGTNHTVQSQASDNSAYVMRIELERGGYL